MTVGLSNRRFYIFFFLYIQILSSASLLQTEPILTTTSQGSDIIYCLDQEPSSFTILKGKQQHHVAFYEPKYFFYLFLFSLRIMSPPKGCPPIGHPYTRDLFLHQSLQADIGKRMLSSPPASLLPRYGRNRIRAGRRTKTQLKRVIQANVCLARRPCQNQFIADSQQ